MCTILSFESIENKHDVYRDKDSMQKFCESLREQAIEIIDFKRKWWSYKQTNSRNHMKIQKFVIFVKKNL